MVRSTKRKRTNDDYVTVPPPTRLQTAGLDTPRSRRISDATVEDTLSPRTAVSARFQGLRLQGSESMSPTRRMTRCSSIRIHEDPGPEPESESVQQMLPGEFIEIAETPEPSVSSGPTSGPTSLPTSRMTRRSSSRIHEDPESEVEPESVRQMSPEDATHISETPEPSDSSISIPETRYDEQVDTALIRERPSQAIFEFTAGGVIPYSPPSSSAELQQETPSKANQPYADPMTPQDSPFKHRDHISESPPAISTPIPRSSSPSARKLSSHKRRSSDVSEIPESSNDADVDADLALSSSASDDEGSTLWWQDSEITGHDPADPDEDNRGVNGIGYQKSKAEAWKIQESKRKQIAEWRSRELKEARKLRSGKRSMGGVLGGRVSKTKSRSGSPVERRSSPGLSLRGKKGAEEVLGMTSVVPQEVQQSPRKGVRFEES